MKMHFSSTRCAQVKQHYRALKTWLHGDQVSALSVNKFVSVFLLFRIPDGLTAEDRILAVLEFYLTSFHAGRKVRFLFTA